jgi:mRNA interferase MazF
MPSRGDIILVPFPFTDLSGQKIRPALVLSKYQKSQDVIVVFITSQKKLSKRFAVEVSPSSRNGIKVNSYIICDKIATLDCKMVIGSIGTIESTVQVRVDLELKAILGL